MEELSSRITKYRRAANLTQKDLGDMLNVSPQAVSKWENGQAEPDASTLIKLCAIFKISTDELLGISAPTEEAAATAVAEDTVTVESEGTVTEVISAEPETTEEVVIMGGEAEATEVVVMGEETQPVYEQPVSQPVQQPVYEQPVQQPAQQPVSETKVIVEQKIINGYCERCKKPVGPNEYEVTHTGGGRGRSAIQHIYCHKCLKEMDKSRRDSEYSDFRMQNRKSILWGAVAGVGTAALFMLLFILLVKLEPVWLTVLIGIVVGIGYFAFVMQIIWGNEIEEVFFFFCKSFKLPGVIFTLDIGGILFLFTFKVIGAILTGILSALIFIAGLFITPVIALVVLPFASIKRSVEGAKLKKEAERA